MSQPSPGVNVTRLEPGGVAGFRRVAGRFQWLDLDLRRLSRPSPDDPRDALN